jgi:hypothetical protein
MSRRTIYILLILIGSALLLASITFWVDTLTSVEPVGLGQQIRDWLAVLVDLLTWIGAYLVKRNDNSKLTSFNVTGGNPQIAPGDHARNVQVNGTYIENADKCVIR